ncbi:MAG: M13 family metallopeptidase [Novosphingobium sp.]
MTRFLRRSLASAGVSLAALALVSAPALAQTQPGWGEFGIQTDAMDTAAKPGDDFNAYANGAWMARTELPADRARFGAFDQLDEQAKVQLRTILDELATAAPAAGTPEARIAAAYQAFMDTDAIEAAGLAPARPWLDRIFAATSREDLVALFAAPGLASPLSAYVDTDDKQSDQYALIVGQAGLGLPDRDYYLKDTPNFIEVRGKYREYLTFLLGQAGYADPAAAAEAVLALETDLARAKWDRATSRKRELTYNKLTQADVQALPQGALLARFVADLGTPAASPVVVSEMPPTAEERVAAKLTPEQVANLGGGVPETLRLVADAPMATWQAWLAARFLDDHAAVLPRAIDEAAFAFHGKLLKGQPEQQARWKRGIAAVESQLGELLGRIYVERHFPARNKAAMDELVVNLRKAMTANLADLSWMSAQTREQALAKLDAFTPKIGYPATFKTYEGLEIGTATPLANAVAASQWDWKRDIAKLGQPVDRAEWFMLPQTVNAYYNPGFNEIVFPAAILQPPFFNLSADPAVNYGAIGAVIGHEIGHGFDDQGASSDGAGNLRDWWTEDDKARFETLQARLGAQYAKFCPFDEGKTCVNPALTMGENIGDIGGLSLAYRAYRLSLDGKEAPVIGGFTGDQRFFLGWAQVWRSKTREALARQRLVTDPHSPPEYRVNGVVRNFDEWYKAFDVKPGDALYLAPKDRVRIW